MAVTRQLAWTTTSYKTTKSRYILCFRKDALFKSNEIHICDVWYLRNAHKMKSKRGMAMEVQQVGGRRREVCLVRSSAFCRYYLCTQQMHSLCGNTVIKEKRRSSSTGKFRVHLMGLYLASH